MVLGIASAWATTIEVALRPPSTLGAGNVADCFLSAGSPADVAGEGEEGEEELGVEDLDPRLRAPGPTTMQLTFAKMLQPANYQVQVKYQVFNLLISRIPIRYRVFYILIYLSTR